MNHCIWGVFVVTTHTADWVW